MKIIQKTWNEFWGEFLLVTFHKNNPDKWESVKQKAEWVRKTAGLNGGEKVLDLGCGSGLMDICLAETGTIVTAIDRIEPVLEIARNQAGNRTVEFIHGDIRKVSYPENTFDCVLILETIGLMSKKDDINLIENSFIILKNNGRLIVDSPRPECALANKWNKKFPEGTLTFEVSYDPESSVQTIIPTLMKDDELIELYDPYNDEIENHKGVKRYLYSADELKNIMERAGFKVIEAAHSWGEDYYLLSGEKI